MRILYVVHGYPPQATGGVELRAFYLARELKKKHDIMIFCGGSNQDLPDYHVEDLQIEGVPVRRVNYNFRDLTSFEGIYLNQRIEEIFVKALDDLRPDVVHIHHLTGLSTGIPEVLRRRDLPQILSLHDFWMGCPRGQRIKSDLTPCPTLDREQCLPCTKEIWGDLVDGPKPGWLRSRFQASDPLVNLKLYDRQIRRILGIPDLLLTPSVFSREIFLVDGVDPDRIRTLPYGLNSSLFEGLTRTQSEKVRFGFVGSVLPTKGVHVLLEAFRKFDRDDVVLDIYGEVVPYHGDMSYVESLKAEIESTPRVRIHGRYENQDLPGILGAIDVLVVPSVWFETYCITIREGFLAGVPVLASNLGAMGEAIEDGVSGLLFESGNAQDLHEKMVRLLDPELRRSLCGQAARVKEIRVNAAELVELYQEIRRKRRRSSGCARDEMA